MNQLVSAPAVEAATPSGTWRDVLSVVRLQLINWRYGIGVPVGILAITLAINLALFASINDVVPPDGRTTGAVLSIYITFGVGYLQTMTQTFVFALGLSVTRRAFYAGVALLAVIEAAGFGALLLLLSLVERATGGWGLLLHFFDLPFLEVGNPFLQWLVFTVPFVAAAAAGVFAGVVFKRWGQLGVYAMSVAVAVVLAGLVLVISWQGWWPAVGGWFIGQSTGVLFAGYPVVLALALGAAGWLAIRRATP